MSFLFNVGSKDRPFNQGEGVFEKLDASHRHADNQEVATLLRKIQTYFSARFDLKNFVEAANRMRERSLYLRGGARLDQIQMEVVAENYYRLMHGIVCYARWFLETTGKSRLQEKFFFPLPEAAEHLAIHKEIMTLRNEYLAHYQHDHLGEIGVRLVRNETGAVIDVDSYWAMKMAWNPEQLVKIIDCVSYAQVRLELLIDRTRLPLVRKLKALEAR